MRILIILLVLAAVISTAILLPFTFIASRLFAHEPPSFKKLGAWTGGLSLFSIPRPRSSFIVLAFGFLVIYNALSWLSYKILLWLPVLDRISGFQIGDLRLNLVIPAAIIAFIVWAKLPPQIRDHG
jgi:hypothetical protein